MSIHDLTPSAIDGTLYKRFKSIDKRIVDLEASVRTTPIAGLDLSALVEKAIEIINELMRAYAEDAGKPMPNTEDPLQVFKAFVKGDPSLNAIRDNVRELVYYKNCLAEGREDALPRNPALMTAHTARHIYLYLSSRCIQEKRFD